MVDDVDFTLPSSELARLPAGAYVLSVQRTATSFLGMQDGAALRVIATWGVTRPARR